MDPVFHAVIGALVSYSVPGGSDVWCMKVNALVAGVGDLPMAWVADVRDERRVLRVALTELKPGCANPPPARAP
jgi:uncharacterized membrane protein